MSGTERGEDRGRVKARTHPWWSYTGSVLGTMTLDDKITGLRVLLDNGIESFVMRDEWESFDDR